MKLISQFVHFNFALFFFTFPAFAQTDSTNSKVVDLQKGFQETVKKYEAFQHGLHI